MSIVGLYRRRGQSLKADNEIDVGNKEGYDKAYDTHGRVHDSYGGNGVPGGKLGEASTGRRAEGGLCLACRLPEVNGRRATAADIAR